MWAGRVPLIACQSLLCWLLSVEIGLAQYTSGAQSQGLTPDARSQGMGRAFTALATGPNTVWWNPAALGVLDRGSFSPFSRAQLVPDLADDVWIHTYGIAVSMRGVGVGLHRSNLDYGESTATDPQGNPVGTFSSNESTTILGAGYDFGRALWPKIVFLEASAGVGFKWFEVDLAPRWATPNGEVGKGDAWDVDLGMLVGVDVSFATDGGEAPDSYARSRVTFVQRNAFDHRLEYDDQNESDPLVVRNVWGFGAEAGVRKIPRFGHCIAIRAETNRVSTPSYWDAQPIRHVGGEVSILNMLFLRRGFIDNEDGDIEGSTSGWGVGLDLDLADRKGPFRRFGFRYDRATVPQARRLDNVTHESVTLWASMR